MTDSLKQLSVYFTSMNAIFWQKAEISANDTVDIRRLHVRVPFEVVASSKLRAFRSTFNNGRNVDP